MSTQPVKSMYRCGRLITHQELTDIIETAKFFPHLPRYELAATICEHLNWYTASGSYKVTACAKLLEQLDHDGVVSLRPKRAYRKRKPPRDKMGPETSRVPATEIRGDLSEFESVILTPVVGPAQTRAWQDMVGMHHYLGYQRPFGCFLRYFITSDKGLLGGIQCAGSAKSLSIRDQWIGWTVHQRLQNLGWVINNNRFLLLPWVRVKNLASFVLGTMIRQIGHDWYNRWGYRPVLVETFVDPDKYSGVSYRASGWTFLGMTTGEGLIRKGKTYSTTPKMIFVRPLHKDFREILCSVHQPMGRDL